jgi:hypothetical protein
MKGDALLIQGLFCNAKIFQASAAADGHHRRVLNQNQAVRAAAFYPIGNHLLLTDKGPAVVKQSPIDDFNLLQFGIFHCVMCPWARYKSLPLANGSPPLFTNGGG